MQGIVYVARIGLLWLHASLLPWLFFSPCLESLTLNPFSFNLNQIKLQRDLLSYSEIVGLFFMSIVFTLVKQII